MRNSSIITPHEVRDHVKALHLPPETERLLIVGGKVQMSRSQVSRLLVGEKRRHLSPAEIDRMLADAGLDMRYASYRYAQEMSGTVTIDDLDRFLEVEKFIRARVR